MLRRASVNRTRMTFAERLLWEGLLKTPSGFQFEAQHVIFPYIVDFVCLDSLLVIEIDGDTHTNTIDSDSTRSGDLDRLGYEVVRFTNQETILTTDYVVRKIVSLCTRRRNFNTKNVRNAKPVKKIAAKKRPLSSMVIPLPRVMHESPAVQFDLRTRASKVTLSWKHSEPIIEEKTPKRAPKKPSPPAIAVSPIDRTPICAVCKKQIASVEIRINSGRDKIGNSLWRHKECNS